MSSTPPTRDHLVATATRLFLERGASATSVDAICAEARLTKGAFFHHFESKAELVRAALDAWVDRLERAFASAPFLGQEDPLERALAFVDFAASLQEEERMPIGCLIALSCAELAETDEQLRLSCDAALCRWAYGLSEILAEAKARYAPHATWDPAEVGAHFVAVYEGATLLARAAHERELVGMHLRQFRSYVVLLFEGQRGGAP